jgi:hypothetical protein
MLPKRTLLDVVDEANGAEVHVALSLSLDDVEFGYIGWVGCVW